VVGDLRGMSTGVYWSGVIYKQQGCWTGLRSKGAMLEGFIACP
jgi:hypothetical protein